MRSRTFGLLLGSWGLAATFATLPATAGPILPAQPNRTINELFSLIVTNTASVSNAAPGGPYTNAYIFNYANRTAFTNDGWNFLATSPGGAVRNTEVTSGAVVSYDQAAHPNVLRIPCDVGDLWGGLNSSRNSIFRNLPATWTTMQLALSLNPTLDYQQVHLALYQDDDNFVQAGLAQNSALGGEVTTLIWEYAGVPLHYFANLNGVSSIWLRLDHDLITGNITQLYSFNGIFWNVLGTTSQALVNPRLCIWVGGSPYAWSPGMANCDLQRLDVVAASGAPVLLTYQLLNPPAGATIDTNGVISWTPSDTAGWATYTLTTVVTDNQVPRASATNSFQVVVNDLGPPWPVLPAISSQTINELTTLFVTNTASDGSLFVKQGVTNTLLFNYPDRASLLADGWSYIATTGGGGARDTEITSGAVVSYDQVGHPGVLRIPCDTGDLWGTGGGVNNTRNSLFRNLPTNWLSLRVAFSFAAIVNVDQAHLTLYQDDDNYLQIGVAYNSGSGGRALTMDIETSGGVTAFARTPTSATNIWLRLDRTSSGGPVTGSYSIDGVNWTALGTNTPPFANPRLALWTGSYNVAYGAGSPALDLKRLDVVSITNIPTVLSYSLVNPPSGASISSSGVVTWTPYELQGPGAATITTIVTDNSVPPLKATNSFLVVVNEINTPPVLPIQANLSIRGISPILVTNTATDSDIPLNSLSYTLAGAPLGAAIDTNGVIAWTPAPTQIPSTNLFVTVVTDSNPWAVNSQNLSATNSFTVIVDAIHNGPSLPALMDVTMPELTLLQVTNTANYSDVPATPLVYTLINPPAGASINTNGVITWLPSEAQGPNTYVFITRVTDNGAPPLSDTNYFAVFVDEVNTAPTLPVQADVELIGATPLWVTNTASDSDIPTNALSYQLSSAPAGAAIDSNGVISWTPSVAQVPSTNLFVTVVTDDNPWAVNDRHLSATNSFTVIVKPVRNGPALPALANVSIPDYTTLRVTNTATYTDLPATTLAYVLLAPPAGATIDANGVITWTPVDGQQATTNVITTVVADNGVPPISATNSFTVVVLAPPAPFQIVSISFSNNLAWVTWEAEAGRTYRLQFKDDLNQADWQDALPDVTATDSTATTSQELTGAAARFYRILVRP